MARLSIVFTLKGDYYYTVVLLLCFHTEMTRNLYYRVLGTLIIGDNFRYFCSKTYVVGTH